MNFDSPAGTVAIGAVVFALIGLLVLWVAGTRAAPLLGMRDDSIWWFSPRGGRTQGLVVAYLAGIVAVAATVFVAVDAVAPTTLAWTCCWSSAAVVVWATVTRVGRYAVHVATDGRATWDDPVEADFVEPDDALDDVDLRTARTAALAGDWLPAAHLLGATVDPDTRFARVEVLAYAAARRGRWLENWLAAHPDDPHALVVRGHAGVVRAWEIRGADWTPRDVDRFLDALHDAEEDITRAVESAPSDPSPLVSRLMTARGLELGVEEHEERLAALRRLAPFHRGGLSQVLQFKAAKWFGSTEEMFGFAREVSAQAPAGSAATLLVVAAHVEQYVALTSRSVALADKHMTSEATRSEIAAAEQRWLDGESGPSPVDKAWAHNLLGFTYWLTEQPERAAAHLAETKQHLAEWPWLYADDPTAVHARVQAWLRQRMPAEQPA